MSLSWLFDHYSDRLLNSLAFILIYSIWYWRQIGKMQASLRRNDDVSGRDVQLFSTHRQCRHRRWWCQICFNFVLWSLLVNELNFDWCWQSYLNDASNLFQLFSRHLWIARYFVHHRRKHAWKVSVAWSWVAYPFSRHAASLSMVERDGCFAPRPLCSTLPNWRLAANSVVRLPVEWVCVCVWDLEIVDTLCLFNFLFYVIAPPSELELRHSQHPLLL